ncbi:AT-hook motif nuclear-localized protein 21 [Linum perenne]
MLPSTCCFTAFDLLYPLTPVFGGEELRGGGSGVGHGSGRWGEEGDSWVGGGWQRDWEKRGSGGGGLEGGIGGGGQVVGGTVVGELTAAGPVIVIGASFNNVVYERMPLEEDGGDQELQSGGGGLFPDGGAAAAAAGLPFVNLPMSMPAVDGWGGRAAALY